MEFFTSDTERMTILSGGNVGIGTNAPGSLLAIESAVDTFLTIETTTATN